MSEIFHKIIRVFIGSPGGLDDERQAVRSVIEETNRQNSANWGIRFEPIGWEETIGGNRRAQALINKDLEKCHYFFGILFDRWGSSPQGELKSENNFTSGFEEEYVIADRLYTDGSMKDVFLFFKRIPDDRIRDPGQDLKRVLQFRKERQEARKPLYFEFPDLDQFKTKIRDYLSNIGWGLYRETLLSEGSSQHQEPQAPPFKEDQPSLPSAGGALFTGETEVFIRKLLAKNDEYDAVAAVEVARLRLIAASLHRSGNDAVQVGAHDANLIFRYRTEIAPSAGELFALLSAGLENFGTQNIPLWHWVKDKRDQDDDILSPIRRRMFFGPDGARRYAIRLARYLGLVPPAFGEYVDRSYVIQSWFDEDVAPDLRREAIEYLRLHGISEDCETLTRINEGVAKSLTNEIDDIVVNIFAKTSLISALDELVKRDPEQVSDALCNILFHSSNAITSERLVVMSRLKATSVRLRAIRELRARGALDAGHAEELSSDSVIEIRYEAIVALAESGEEVAEERARTALVKKSTGGIAIGLGFGRDAANNTYFEKYQTYLLARKPLVDLLSLDANESAHSASAFFAACSRYPRQTEEDLRTQLRSGFRKRFDAKVLELKKTVGDIAPDLISQTMGLRDFSCGRQTDEGLQILARVMDKSDLELVRQVIDNGEVIAGISILNYLHRFGEWQDVERLLRLKRPFRLIQSVLYTPEDGTVNDIARALHGVSRGRLSDLFEKVTEPALRAAVYRQLTVKELLHRNDEAILQDLNHESETLRKTVSARCVEAFSKKRIANLLRTYTERDEYRYYNVIHWLDLGVSMPMSIAKKLVRAELASM